MSTSADWRHLTDWWLDQVERDPEYRDTVIPLLIDLLQPEAHRRYLDLGCGEGQVLRAIQGRGSTVVGCDMNVDLLRRVSAPTVCCVLPALDWARSEAFDGAYACLVLEHLADLPQLFRKVAGAVKDRGVLAVVVNHPLFTAPGSGPVIDQTDGEVFWRWGAYLESGTTNEPAGSTTVTFLHRPMAELLNSAAGAGWQLEWIEERGIHVEANGDPLQSSQVQIPRLLAIRWRLAKL